MSFDPENLLLSAPISQPAAWELANPDAVIVVAPFANASGPSLGPGILMAGCLRKNVKCHIFHANLLFSAIIGDELYQKIAWHGDSLAGDALFASAAFCSDCDELVRFIGENYGDLHLSVDEYYKITRMIPGFLNLVTERLIATGAKIIGFSSLYNQNTSSLAIARHLKDLDPTITIAIGGSSVINPMARALSEVAPMIDYFFSGDADADFPDFCENILDGAPRAFSRVIDCRPVDDMDSVEIPIYDDYFEQLSILKSGRLLPADWPDRISFESSRGCWWGQKFTCRFCGLNTIDIRYRKKSRSRILNEIVHLRHTYNVESFIAVDCVMPENFEDELSDLSQLDDGLSIFYEVRSNVRPALLDAFVKAGIVLLQPGIESLCTSVLKKMGKGVTALQNLKLLREARSRQIALWWNLLVGTPGEKDEDYEQLLDTLPLIEHFQPPQGIGVIGIHRYSPYFRDPEKYNIKNLRPNGAYELIYPKDTNLNELSYIFSGDWESIRTGASDTYARLRAHYQHWDSLWKELKVRPLLYMMKPVNGVRMVKDTRGVATQTFTALDPEQVELLGLLCEPRRSLHVPEHLKPHLAELSDRKFIIEYENHYISLVTDPFIGIDIRKQRNTANPADIVSMSPEFEQVTKLCTY